ncbi:acyltransferase [Paenibacillus sp. FSL R5-0527]|uniref:acyltransferase family protein n=1 Tax=Paenibacillus sp. FSL R5-0527 TaxID=2975321 RepID=UPI00097A3745|nr:hypothetical protein BK140_14520 [Paenibacillus macerans]
MGEAVKLNTKYLDGLRFWFAMWVVLDHFYAFLGGNNFFSFPYSWTLLNGAVPVDGFITITGFLMMYHYVQRQAQEPYHYPPTIWKFWLRRLYRLYPLYVIAILAAFIFNDQLVAAKHEILKFFTGDVITGFNMPYGHYQPGLKNLLSNLAFTHGFYAEFAVGFLDPAWSLSLEMQFYFVFPFLYACFFAAERRIRWVGLLIPAAFVLAYAMPKLFGIYGTAGLFNHFPVPSILFYKLHLFLYGMLLAAVGLGKVKARYLFASLLTVLLVQQRLSIVMVLVITLFLFLEPLKQKKIIPGAVYKWLAGVRWLFGNRLSAFGANLSYSMYLIHLILFPVVVTGVIHYTSLSKLDTALVALGVYLAVLFAVSTVLYYTIEKPFIALGKKRMKAWDRKLDQMHETFSAAPLQFDKAPER